MNFSAKKNIVVIVFVLLLSVLYITYSKEERPKTVINDTDFQVQSLTDNEIQALQIAIDDEYKARETYLRVIEIFG